MASWDSEDWQPRDLSDEEVDELCRQYDLEFGFLHGGPTLNAEHGRRRTRMLVELYANADDDVFRNLGKAANDSN